MTNTWAGHAKCPIYGPDLTNFDIVVIGKVFDVMVFDKVFTWAAGSILSPQVWPALPGRAVTCRKGS